MRFRRGWCRWLLGLSPIEHIDAQPWLGKFPHQYRRNANRSEASDIEWQTWGTGSNVEGISASIGQERRGPARAITGPEILTPPR
jgi:hypothetical protein